MILPNVQPPCAYCDAWEECAQRRSGAPTTDGCFVPRRHVSIGKIRRFFVGLRQAAGLPADPYLAVEATLLAHLSEAMRRYSNTLEFSFSTGGAADSPYRFSYAFPSFGVGRARAAVDACLALVTPFGPGARSVADRVLACAVSPAVAQILFGIDARPGARRLKLYFQFPPGGARVKLAILSRLLPSGGAAHLADRPERLHLLGVDFDTGDATGYKLYYLHNRVEPARLARSFPGTKFPVRLAAQADAAALDDVVLVSRLGPSGAFEGPPVSEIDIGLRANGLGWEDAAACLGRRAAGRALAAFARGALACHRWAATRVSIPVNGGPKMNVYYVLLDPP